MALKHRSRRAFLSTVEEQKERRAYPSLPIELDLRG
jgi:hypothetical protein